MAYKQILVPLDGSKLSEQALAHLVEVAAPGAVIQLLSVKSSDTLTEMTTLARTVADGSNAAPTWPPIDGVDDPHAANAREAYMRKVKEWLQAAEFDVRIDIKTGNVTEAILQAAAGTDLIVMATYHISTDSRMMLGGVVEAVLQQAPCPVLIVPGVHEDAA